MAHRSDSRDPSASDAALDALDVTELRGIIRDLLEWLDDPSYARLANELVDRAARNASGWSPVGPADEVISEIVAFAEAARRVGCADPAEVDDFLRQGMNAFLARDYPAALQIFRALLPPIASADIDLGQHEMVDEVLGVEIGGCAIQYVVCVYTTSAPQDRAKAVLTAVDDVRAIGFFREPLAAMERAAVEPLPCFHEFLPQWRELVDQRIPTERGHQHYRDWDTDEDRWLREVVGRTDGVGGLAGLARSSGRADDFRAWCHTLIERSDWKAALRACEEAADRLDGGPSAEFLDRAVLAAYELGREDLPTRSERAWRAEPSGVRLRRWLGTEASEEIIRKRAEAALEACPEQAQRQRALLQVLHGDLVLAAKLLESAPGLGWSDTEHPGHFLFPVFCALLGADEAAADLGYGADEKEFLESDSSGVATPSAAALLALAGVAPLKEGKDREAVLSAMRNAAERRIQGVTGNQRRRHYAHAAALALACGKIDPTPAGEVWLVALRERYRRYPALKRELSELRER